MREGQMTKEVLTQERLKELLDYDKDTGVFTRKIRVSNNAKEGGIAGCMDNSVGYLRITIDGSKYWMHRLAWLYVFGKFPKNQIDHINNIRNDNRIDNLREATSHENKYNSKLRSNNTSGIKGVSYDKSRSKWVAQLRYNGILKNIGRFETKEEAKQAVIKLREKEHGEFANNG